MKKGLILLSLSSFLLSSLYAKDKDFDAEKLFKKTCSICHGYDGMDTPPGGSATQLIAAMDSEYLYNKLVAYAKHEGGNPRTRVIMYAVMDKYKLSAKELQEIAEYVSRLGVE